jgi:hypothetical protein
MYHLAVSLFMCLSVRELRIERIIPPDPARDEHLDNPEDSGTVQFCCMDLPKLGPVPRTRFPPLSCASRLRIPAGRSSKIMAQFPEHPPSGIGHRKNRLAVRAGPFISRAACWPGCKSASDKLEEGGIYGKQSQSVRTGVRDRVARRRTVDRLGVGIDDDANLNAPSSLSGKPTHSH